ncbi:MAG: Undecaprenyl-diphosphatase [Promethearchaeota archaeon]|nr:MAG: Undecaprenyl-diphosphatase [Candidatus Lokiarchaeota archaeon]
MNSQEKLKNLESWDQKQILKYNGYGGRFFTYILRVVSFVGRETIWLFLIVYFSFIWFDPRSFSYIGIGYLLGIIIIVPIKQIIRRKRPSSVLEDIVLYERKSTSGSFPSWHSYNAASQAIIIGYIISSPIMLFLLLGGAGVIAFSRVQLGSHYPSDAIVGYIIGIIGAIITILFLGPLLFNLILQLNNLSTIQFEFYTFNSLLYTNILYLIMCVMIFGSIILLSSLRYIKGLL